MMGWSPRCYIPSFVEIGLPVPKKKIIEGFYHIWAWQPSLSCGPASCHQILISLYLKAYLQNLVHNCTVVSEKIRFYFLYVLDHGPRESNDLDIQYSHTFIYTIRCLLLPTFRSLAAKVSEKSTAFTFSYRTAHVTKFDLAVK